MVNIDGKSMLDQGLMIVIVDNRWLTHGYLMID